MEYPSDYLSNGSVVRFTILNSEEAIYGVAVWDSNSETWFLSGSEYSMSHEEFLTFITASVSYADSPLKYETVFPV